MNSSSDLATRELTGTRLKLLDELVFVPQQYSDETFYHIEVPSKSKFYRVGYSEYVFISLLDGNTTFAQAVTITARTLGTKALSQQKALEVYTWLLENGLARLGDDTGVPSQVATDNSRSGGGLLAQFNPFWAKARLLNPDSLLKALLPFLGWLFSIPVTVLGLVVICLGAAVIHGHWDRFLLSSKLVFSPHNWLGLALAWLLLKVVHELAHGLACKRYHGEVREMGLIFILFAPMAYVDVTSSWRFPSRWQRIHVAMAGMYVELVLASIAALVWLQTDSEIIAHFLYNVIVMASISTIAFNANPLMRFDGYYILSDLLEVPNLYTDGARYVQRLANWLFFAEVTSAPQSLGLCGWFTRFYGVASAVWRVVVCVSLLLAASVMFKGAGIILGVLGFMIWFAQPLARMVRTMHGRFYESPHTFGRALVVAGTLAGITMIGLKWFPWPGTIAAPAVVEYTNLAIIRSRISGFVDRIHVTNGQRVEAGALLLELRNEDLETELSVLQHAIEQSRIRHRVALDAHDATQHQVESRKLQALEERHAEKQRQYDSLQVRAPVAGRIVARRLEHIIGKYIAEGQELLAVGDENRKELIVSIAQNDVDQVLGRVGQTARFRIGSQFAKQGVLKRVEPRASRTLTHPALSAKVGGVLPVSAADNEQGSDELLEPRFKAVISISDADCRQLYCGQRGYAVFGWSRESLGQHLGGRFSEWLDGRLKPLRD